MTPVSNWLLNGAIAYSTPFLLISVKAKAGLRAKIFFFMGKVLFDLCVLCVSMIYETKELSLDELYEKVGQA